ncbi:MAG: hypothetical protein PHH59_09865 [Methylovulum sp.]|uniref:hypothetical protein n=1 Tax=Methylovulum sp. TaxID=1916980 RepID=UPI002607A551|nr:hypothetical protein [Methylovulum sp.]MDD2724312.1 hypothetical protein [Methylovulum sp.]MDD5122955.1 hypothetical protein [Methylovulum sp.]
MIFIQRTDEPDVLKTTGQAEQLALCAQFEQGNPNFEFKSSIYGHNSVKTALRTMQHGKCCFCEAKITHISYGDVEHYRPKGGHQQKESDKLTKPGYYWLTYTWGNLLFCCTLCNQQYKKNLFPLKNPASRARSHHDDVAAEEPLLINPSVLNPQDYIGFRDEIPYPIADHIYGKTTITILELDREALNETRRSKLGLIKNLLAVIEIATEQPDNQQLQQLVGQTKQNLKQQTASTAEFSTMVSAFVFSKITL